MMTREKVFQLLDQFFNNAMSQLNSGYWAVAYGYYNAYFDVWNAADITEEKYCDMLMMMKKSIIEPMLSTATQRPI